MSTIPLHPAVVHLPIGISLLLPLLALGVAILVGRKTLPRAAWGIVVFLQAVALAGGLASTSTGEDDRRQTVVLVGSGPVNTHEADGRAFNVAAGVSLAVGLVGFIPASAARAAAVLATGVGAFRAYAAGRSGGELVYRHNAGAAYGP